MYYVGIGDCLIKKEAVGIVIDTNNDRQNLLCCDLFGTDELEGLKLELNDSRPEIQIVMLARFLKRNIKSII